MDKNSSNAATQLKQAVTALKDMRAKLESLQQQRSAPIAVVGMSCRFPGGANSTAAYWDLLKEGRDAISELPAGRFAAQLKQKLEQMGAPEARWGGFLEEVDQFDPGFFGITPREAIAMDPQQRLLLEVAWEALEDAGLPVPTLAGTRTGVFVGVHSHSSDYYTMQKDFFSEDDIYVGTGTAHNVIAGRLSYLFDWRGPSVAVDTACSSSLVAVHLAVQSLRAGESDLCLAAGVNVILGLEFTLHAARMSMLSPDGRCKAFDDSANGFVRGEGCGVVVLKRLSEAIEDGDPVLAVIRGTAVNQDGKSNGLTAPNGLSQQALIRAALENARVKPNEIGYVEAHGTGTPLGDPIEVDSLSRVLSQDRSAGNVCLLGSAKASVGHLEGAAGIAGFIKSVLVLKNRAIPPQVHFKRLNPHIALGKQFEIPTALQAWPGEGQKRYAGVSSFGWSGTNAHIVLEEAGMETARSKDEHTSGQQLLVLSGHTSDALQSMAREYVEFLNSQSGGAKENLQNICYTASVRRTHQEHRLAVVGASCKEIAMLIDRYLLKDQDAAVCAGRAENQSAQAKPDVANGTDSIDAASREKRLQLLAKDFVAGREIDWAKLFPAGSSHVALPHYRWQKKKYWIETGSRTDLQSSTVPARTAPGKRLASPHPIYEFELHPESSPVFADHCIGGTPVVPGALYLEMGYSAVLQEFGPGNWVIEHLRIVATLTAEAGAARCIQTILSRESKNHATFEIFSSLSAGGSKDVDWTLHASGKVSREAAGFSASKSSKVNLASLRPRSAHEIAGGQFYRTLQLCGVNLGERLHTIERVWVAEDEALAQVKLASTASPADGRTANTILVDGVLQTLLAAVVFKKPANGSESYVLTEIGFCEMAEPLPPTLWSHARVGNAGESPATLNGEIDVFDEEGRRVARLSGLKIQRVQTTTRPDWFYEVSWPEKPLLAETCADFTPHCFPAPEIIADEVEPGIANRTEAVDLERTRTAAREIEVLARDQAAQALQRLGFDFQPGRQFEESETANQLAIAPQHRRLFRRLLEILFEDKIIDRDGSAWIVARRPEPRDLATVFTDLAKQYPAIEIEATLLARCGESLPEVLRGQTDPLKLLFPSGAANSAADLYDRSTPARFYNSLVRDTLAAALSNRPNTRPCRILEIGAGTGGTTKCVLEKLPIETTEYVFTDVSKLFLSEAERFARHPGMRFGLLDIERDPILQGFAPRSFDIILAANVLHATRELRSALNHIRKLLAPGGLLVLLETTAPRRWVDLTFGLTEGWWKFSDNDVRPSHPLLAPEGWLSLLSQQGFDCAKAIGQQESVNTIFEQAIFVAQEPKEQRKVATGDAQIGNWLILGDDKAQVGERLAEQVRARGGKCLLVSYAIDGQQSDSRTHIDPTQRKDYEQILARAAAEAGGGLQGIVHLWSLDTTCQSPGAAGKLAEARRLGCESVLLLVQALESTPAIHKPKLWFVTREAQPTGRESGPLSVAQAPLWGMGRSLALEYPDLWGGLMDLDKGSSSDVDAERLIREITSNSGEDQIAWRGSARHIARLVTAPPTFSIPVELKPDGAYLVTGGFGRLGIALARWLVERGARQLVLIGRRGFVEHAKWSGVARDSEDYWRAEALRSLEAMGARIDFEKADVGDRDRMELVFRNLASRGAVVRGVFHAATQVDFRLMRDMDVPALRAMLRAKIEGSWNLHELTELLPLDFFVMFSSATALVGAKASAHYAAGNQFLDALAHHRRALGLPALTIDWGVWNTSGITADLRKQMDNSWWRPMDVNTALAAMGDLMGSATAQQMVASFEVDVIKAAFQEHGRRPFLDELKIRRPARTIEKSPTEIAGSLVWTGSPQEQAEMAEIVVAEEVKRVMGLGPSDTFERDRGLFEMGLDSLMSVKLRLRLEAAFGASLSSSVIFNHSTVAALAAHLTREVLKVNVEETLAPLSEVEDSTWDAMAKEIDGLSEEELRAELAREARALLTEQNQ